MRSIDKFLWLRTWLINIRRPLFRLLVGVDIPPTASVSLSVRFIPTAKGPITIGSDTLIAFKTLVLGYDPVTGKEAPVEIGRNCFIGAGTVICPGVTIGDGSIVGAGSVVISDIAADSIAAGNPARVVKRGINAGVKGRLPGANETARQAKLAWQEQLRQ